MLKRHIEEIFIDEIKESSPLNREEERELFKRLRNSDGELNIEVYHELIRHNLRFVLKVANTFNRNGLDLLDLIDEAVIGLSIAILKFDLNRNFRLITYAVGWIKQRLILYCPSQISITKIPVGSNNIVNKINRSKNNDLHSWAKELGVSEKKILDVLAISKSYFHSNGPNNNPELGYHFLNHNENEAEDKLISFQDRELINACLSELSTIEAGVAQRYFGLNGFESSSHAKIGKYYNFTSQNSSLVLIKAKRKIKTMLLKRDFIK